MLVGMSRDEVFTELAYRVRRDLLTVSTLDIARWTDGTVEELISTGVLRVMSHAKSITCEACGDDHVESVHYVQSPPGSPLRAYISCPREGRVLIPLDRLRQWIVVPALVPNLEGESGDPLDRQATPTDEPLPDRGQDLLVAMLELELFDSDHRKPAATIVAHAFGPDGDANANKAVMLDLKNLGFIESRPGPGGGSWLTPKGRMRSEKLQNK